MPLDDFHYDVLQSSVDYHENGKLLLGLRLQGSNPDLEKGRPVNQRQSGGGYPGTADQPATERPGQRNHSPTCAGAHAETQGFGAMSHTGEPPMRLCALFAVLLLGSLTMACTPTPTSWRLPASRSTSIST